MRVREEVGMVGKREGVRRKLVVVVEVEVEVLEKAKKLRAKGVVLLVMRVLRNGTTVELLLCREGRWWWWWFFSFSARLDRVDKILTHSREADVRWE